MTRIVKMKFRPESVDEFLGIFTKYHSQIAGFENCLSVELLNDRKNKTIFFTYSKWKSEEDLNKYRNSELFNEVWSQTKVLFEEKVEAWSVDKIK